MPQHELLVERVIDRGEAVRAVNASSEKQWLKTALLGVALLDQPFGVLFDDGSEATELANRIREFGFLCKVCNALDPSQRVSHINDPGDPTAGRGS